MHYYFHMQERENKFIKERLRKIEILKREGALPYPEKSNRTHQIQECLSNFDKLEAREEEIVLCGRIRMIRRHGKLTFLTIEDVTGSMQLLLSEDATGKKAYKLFSKIFDSGDFIEARGSLFITKRGEKTLKVIDYHMLSKSILPLPDKWHGLQSIEEKLRKRYLDILFNPEIKEMIKKRAIFWNSIRNFLTKKGFLEVETPILEVTAGGADARPFVTNHNSLNMDLYLRISMGELWQKKLMVAGFEKTFEIGRQFRNEGMDAEHLQDYTQMEFYWAYSNHKQTMKLVESLYRYVAQKTFGTLKFKMKNFDVDLSQKWERYDYAETIKKHTKVDIYESDLSGIVKALKKLNIKYDEKGISKGKAIDSLWKHCRKNIGGPGFLINIPIIVSPLAKKNEKNPHIASRFQVILGGSEIGNGYSELNDPIDQEERFIEQQKLRDSGDDEAQMLDRDFIEALQYGMPPACGFGLSERLFSFLMNKTARECQIFPLVKPKNEL